MSGPLVQPSAAFAQQGQVDWVALTNSTVNLSVAALAKFSKAKVDVYTIQVGKALCWRFRLAPRVQGDMHDTIQKLNKYGVCQDVLWFGFRIKQTITDLSETEEGLSFVTLCAVLLTTFDSFFAAQVLREMCLRVRAPESCMPSLSQWRQVLSLCSGVLMGSHFSQVLHGICLLSSGSVSNASRRMSDPHSLADALIELAMVQSRSTAHLVLSCGGDYSLLAAFADQILCLDIAILGNDDEILLRSQTRKGKTPQVTFLTNSNPRRHLEITEKIALVPVGHKLIYIDPSSGVAGSVSLRSSWSTVLHDAFGDILDSWLSKECSRHFLRIIHLLSSGKSSLSKIHDVFRVVEDILEKIPPISGEGHANNIPNHALLMLPELQQFSVEGQSSNNGELEDLIANFPRAGRADDHGKHFAAITRHCSSCMVAVPSAIAIYVQLLSCSDQHPDVSPSSLGLRWLHQFIVKRRYASVGKISLSAIQLAHAIFTGRPHHFESDDADTPAQSGRGICVYRAGIDNPIGTLDSVVRLQVVRGYISHRGQRYYRITDLQPSSKEAVWSGDKLQLTSKHCEKRHTSQETDVVKVEMLIKESEDSRQLHVGYSMHCLYVHAHDGWVSVRLEHMMASFVLALRNSSCVGAHQMTQCRVKKSAVHQRLRASFFSRVQLEKQDVERLQTLFQQANVPRGHVILGEITTEEIFEIDKGYSLHIGDAHVLYLRLLTLASENIEPSLRPFTRCLHCLIQDIAIHGCNFRLLASHPYPPGTTVNSAFRFYGLSKEEETLTYSFPFATDEHSTCTDPLVSQEPTESSENPFDQTAGPRQP